MPISSHQKKIFSSTNTISPLFSLRPVSSRSSLHSPIGVHPYLRRWLVCFVVVVIVHGQPSASLAMPSSRTPRHRHCCQRSVVTVIVTVTSALRWSSSYEEPGFVRTWVDFFWRLVIVRALPGTCAKRCPRSRTFRRALVTGFAQRKQSSYKTEGVRAQFVGGRRTSSSCVRGLHNIVQSGGQKKKIGQS